MDSNSTIAFVIGWPISHSLSPDLHGFWLNEYGIKGSYEKIAVKPDDLKAFLEELKNGKYIGGNITIPHKEEVFRALAKNNKTLAKLEAVNTLWLEEGEIRTANTDGYGFAANLDDFSSNWRNSKTATILGAGGAARAIVHQLVGAGIQEIIIVNRTKSRADVLAEKMGLTCRADSFDNVHTILKQTDLLINTTSMGMKDQPELDIDLTNLPATAIVTDIVYNPLKTPLLQQAASLNLQAIDGIGMLLHQAVPGFEKWFGVRPRVTKQLRTHILNILKAENP